MGNNNSQKVLKRHLSTEARPSRDLLQGNALSLKKIQPKSCMIEKLNKNELNYENNKTIFRKKFTSGTISD